MIAHLERCVQRLRLFDRNLIIFWGILSLMILVFSHNQNYWYVNFSIHILFIGLILEITCWLDSQKNAVFKFVRYWYIIFAFPFLYMDVGSFIHLITSKVFDSYIIQFDNWLFGTLPNIWVQQYVCPVLTEVMQIAYSSYWITIPLGGAFFYFSRQFELFERLLHYVTLTFFLSYLLFIIFPVAGPRFYIADQINVQYQSLFLGNYLRDFVSEVGFRGGAFPSSHVGVAVVILIFMWRFKPKIALFVFLPLVIGLSLSTVYGQYHYISDIFAGLIMGVIIGWWGTAKTANSLQINNETV